jgi:hypothetical protein
MAVDPNNYPTHWHPLAKRFLEESPSPARNRNFIFNTTYGSQAGYLKIETDYTEDSTGAIFRFWNPDGAA